jgi:hypothetical protein
VASLPAADFQSRFFDQISTASGSPKKVHPVKFDQRIKQFFLTLRPSWSSRRVGRSCFWGFIIKVKLIALLWLLFFRI